MKSNVLKLFRTAIGAVDPYLCVKNHLVFENRTDNSNEIKEELNIGNKPVVLNRNLYVAAFGKAALGRTKKRQEIELIRNAGIVPLCFF